MFRRLFNIIITLAIWGAIGWGIWVFIVSDSSDSEKFKKEASSFVEELSKELDSVAVKLEGEINEYNESRKPDTVFIEAPAEQPESQPESQPEPKKVRRGYKNN